MLTLYLVLGGIGTLSQLLNLTVQNGPYRSVGSVISILVVLLDLFLFLPAQMGAVYLEMDQRMEGRVGSVYQLFRYALPVGLKRVYSTFFALVAVGIIAVIAFYLVFVVLGFAVLMPTMFLSLAQGGFTANAIPPGMIGGLVFLGLVMLFFFLSLSAFLTPVYPIVAHEGIRAFRAISRSYKLAVKRYGRFLLYSLLMVLISLSVAWLPALILRQNMSEPSIIHSLITWLVSALVAPFWPALATVLYADSAAHLDALAAIAPEKPPKPLSTYYQPAQPDNQPQDNLQALPNSWVDTRPQENQETHK